MIAALARRAIDALYAVSDASHRARGWEVRKGQFGGRRYRLDVAAWLESQRRVDRFGSAPGAMSAVGDEADELFDSMRWTDADMTPVLRQAVEAARAAGVPFKEWAAPRCEPFRVAQVRSRREVA